MQSVGLWHLQEDWCNVCTIPPHGHRVVGACGVACPDEFLIATCNNCCGGGSHRVVGACGVACPDDFWVQRATTAVVEGAIQGAASTEHATAC